jgi:hypothetical protein
MNPSVSLTDGRPALALVNGELVPCSDPARALAEGPGVKVYRGVDLRQV